MIVDSEDYRKILEAYTDKDGKLSYKLLNRDLIKFEKLQRKVTYLKVIQYRRTRK